ncbi:hypothetical protein GWK47_011822 [Chionoecetes opilio]|uniref:Uncharacterized protein n=1 Tax=Chionoecetes opilio TaxID=41210 RepID=A0A8J5C2D4_CHIOP|nr:hypothetical protein GWK47_011822 [Chionoecetes opilio]
MAEKEKMAKAEKLRRWTFPTLRHRHLDHRPRRIPRSRGNIIAGQELPQEAAEGYTGKGSLRGQDEPLRPEGDPTSSRFVASSSGLTPASQSTLRRSRMMTRTGACGGHQDLLPRFSLNAEEPPLIVHWDGKLLPDLTGRRRRESLDRLPNHSFQSCPGKREAA